MILSTEFTHNNETAVKIRYNSKFRFYEALTAAVNPKTGTRIQKYGNDWNCTGQSLAEVKTKILQILD